MPKAAPKSPELNIDLLPKEGTGGGAIHWILTIGRYLIIITEVVALATFVIGILLSKEKNDLKSSIKAKSAEVATYQKCSKDDDTVFCEQNFRKVQTQLNQIAQIRDNHFPTNEVVREFLVLLPIGVEITQFSLEANDVRFSGSFLTERELQTLINSFNRSEKLTNLDITELVKEEDFKFTATAQIEKSVILAELRKAEQAATEDEPAELPSGSSEEIIEGFE